MTIYLPSPKAGQTKSTKKGNGKNRTFYRISKSSEFKQTDLFPVSAVAARLSAHGAAEIGQGGKYHKLASKKLPFSIVSIYFDDNRRPIFALLIAEHIKNSINGVGMRFYNMKNVPGNMVLWRAA